MCKSTVPEMKRHPAGSLCVVILLLSALFGSTVDHSCAYAEEKSVLKGQVMDAECNGVEGAMVFVYDSPQVRRPGDFISGHTDKDGMYRMVMPPGTYWAVARLKKSGDYGPLMPGDRHSGDPVEIEMEPGGETVMDFTVTDLQEAIEIRKEERERPVRISGRIIDQNGSPVRTAFAIASRTRNATGIPDYLSPWVDKEGRYILYVPAGTYFIGGALSFPPDQNYFMDKEMEFDEDRTDIDIVIMSQKPASE
jgi:hypothetical protein